MFFMPGTRMLFGDAKTSCDGKCHLREYLQKELVLIHLEQPSKLPWRHGSRLRLEPIILLRLHAILNLSLLTAESRAPVAILLFYSTLMLDKLLFRHRFTSQ
jgi:hypothetical protein